MARMIWTSNAPGHPGPNYRCEGCGGHMHDLSGAEPWELPSKDAEVAPCTGTATGDHYMTARNGLVRAEVG